MDKVQKSVSAWRELGFEDLQKLLDEQGIKIAEYSSAGSSSRKDLSQKTKEFRKLENEEKLNQVKPLLKMYQQEIDTLATRAKYAESCFLSVYKQLADAPNPVPLLELSATASGELESLKEQNLLLERQLEAQKDYDSLKKQLDNQAKLIDQKVNAKETELHAYWEERQKGWKSQENDYVKSIDEYRSQVAVLESKLEGDSGVPESSHKRSAQVSALEHEIERKQSKIASLDARVADLRQELEKERNVAKDTSEQIRLENENTTLTSRIEQLQNKASDNFRKSSMALEDLETQLHNTQSSLQVAQKRLAQQSDYGQIKEELELLRQVEFGNNDESTGEHSEAIDILRSKNNKLQNDLKNLRITLGKLTSENDGYKQSITVLQDQLKTSSHLVEKLEGDLSTMSRDETFSTVSGWTAAPRQPSPASSIRGTPGPIAPTNGGPTTPVSNNIMNILTQQRDRFKEKCHELQEDLHRCKNSITSLSADLDALKRDNGELYAQLRRDKGGRFHGVYDEEMSNLQTIKSLGLDHAEGNIMDRAFYTIVKKTIVDRGYRYGTMAWTVCIHLLLLWLCIT